jgi:hypothetical protein
LLGRVHYLALFSLVEGRVELLESSQQPDIYDGQGDDDGQKEDDGIGEAKKLGQNPVLCHVIIEDRLLSKHQHQIQAGHYYDVG